MGTAKEFRCIPKGAGGTFHINRDQANNRIGTVHCDDSLGIYFRIDLERVFCAHFSVENIPTTFSEEQGDQLSHAVWQRLETLAKKENWAIDGNEFGEEMLLVCRDPTRETKSQVVNGVGKYLVIGVRLFLMVYCRTQLSLALKARPDQHDVIEQFVNPFFEGPVDQEAERLYDQFHKISARQMHLEACQKGHGFVISSGVEMVVLDDHGKYFVDLQTWKVDESSYLPTGRSSYVSMYEEMEPGVSVFSIV